MKLKANSSNAKKENDESKNLNNSNESSSIKYTEGENLIIEKVNNLADLQHLFVMLSISKNFRKVIFKNIEINEELLKIIQNFDHHEKVGVVFELNGVISEVLLNELKNVYLKKSIIIINQSIIIGSEHSIFKSNAGFISSLKFYNNGNLSVDGLKFKEPVVLSAFQSFLKSKIQINNISFKNCSFAVIDDLGKLIEQNHPLIKLINLEDCVGDFIFKGLIIKSKADLRELIINNKENIKIPKYINKIGFKNNLLLIENTDFEKHSENIGVFLSFIMKFLTGIEFKKCSLNLDFFNQLKSLNFDKNLESKIISFQDCFLQSKNNFNKDNLIENFVTFIEKNSFPWLVKFNSFLFAKFLLSEQNTLIIKNNNINLLEFILEDDKISQDLAILKFQEINLEQKHQIIIEKILTLNIFQVIQFNFCTFKENFLEILENLKKHKHLTNNKKIIFVGSNTNSEIVKSVILGFKQLTNYIQISNVDRSLGASKKENKKISDKDLINSNIMEQIKKAKDESVKKCLERIPLMAVGQPGQVLAELTGIPFLKISEDEIIQNFRKILDSWIFGYSEIKNNLVLNLMSFMNGRPPQKPIVLIGPPGIGKSTFFKAVAAVIRYVDTGDFFGSLYDPVKGDRMISPWLFVVQCQEITSKEKIIGFLKTYKGSEAGVLVKALTENEKIVKIDDKEYYVFNRMICLDEIDKMKSHQESNLIEVLLNILNIDQRAYFKDAFLDAEISLEKVFFLLAGNNMNDILTAPIVSRLNKQDINPLSFEEFRQLAYKKWQEVLNKYGINKNQDFKYNSLDFLEFIELIGPSQIRDLIENLQHVAQHIFQSKNNGKTDILVDKNLFKKLFPKLFYKTSNIFSKPGFAVGVFKKTDGSYSVNRIIASLVSKSYATGSDKVNFIGKSDQQSMNSFHSIKYGFQSAILSALSQVAKDLSIYATTISQNNFSIDSESSFDLSDLGYVMGPVILAIISQVTKKSVHDVAMIGSLGISGFFSCPEGDNGIGFRLGNLLKIQNTITRVFILPNNLTDEEKSKMTNMIHTWAGHIKIPLKDLKILFTDSLNEIIEEVFLKNNA